MLNYSFRFEKVLGENFWFSLKFFAFFLYFNERRNHVCFVFQYIPRIQDSTSHIIGFNKYFWLNKINFEMNFKDMKLGEGRIVELTMSYYFFYLKCYLKILFKISIEALKCTFL